MEEKDTNKKPRFKKNFKNKKKVAKKNNQQILEQPISELNLIPEIAEILNQLNIRTIAQLVEKNEKQLMKNRALNRKYMGAIKKALNDKALRLDSGKNADKADTKAQAPDARTKQEKNSNKKNNQKNQNVKLKEVDLKIQHEQNRPAREGVVYSDDIYIAFEKNNKFGFKDKKSQIVIEPKFDSVSSYKEDLCCVEFDGLYGFIDRQGEFVIEPKYDVATSFSEGYACVFRGEKCGYIDKYGNIVVEFKYDAGTYVIDGGCRVKSDGKWGELHIDNPRNIRWIV